MKRRQFIALLGLAGSMSPLVARSQHAERVRRVGVVLPGQEDPDQEYEARLVAFVQTLRDLGWVEGRSVQFEVLRPKPTAADIGKHVTELVAAAPDVILSSGGTTLPSVKDCEGAWSRHTSLGAHPRGRGDQ
jgi:hypothetical protein